MERLDTVVGNGAGTGTTGAGEWDWNVTAQSCRGKFERAAWEVCHCWWWCRSGWAGGVGEVRRGWLSELMGELGKGYDMM